MITTTARTNAQFVGLAMQNKRSTSLHTAVAALRRWAVSALQSLTSFPMLPGTPIPWDGSGICKAVIRGGGTAHSATAALAYTGPDGQSHLELFRGHNPEGLVSRAATSARLDALERVLQNPTSARATCLFIDDPVLRAEVAATIESFPSLELATAPAETLSLTASQAATRANSTTIENTVASIPRSETGRRLGGSTHLVIATDASIIPGQPGAGIASVATDGTIWQDRLPDTCDITWAEMKAIHAAVAGSANHPHVVVLSDNQAAVDFANGRAIPVQKRMRRLATQIQTLRAGRDVNIGWVRAHRGHHLNEAADAMARQARHLHATAPAA